MDIYLDFRFQVQLGLAIASIVIEVTTYLVYYNSKKTQVIYGKNIKEMLYFNMFSILCILLLIGVINSPIYTSKINLDSFNQSIDNEAFIISHISSELKIEVDDIKLSFIAQKIHEKYSESAKESV